MGVEDVLDRLGTTHKGLDAAEVEKRLERYGPNELPTVPGTPVYRILWDQLKNPLIMILIVAGVVTYFLGEWIDTSFIAAVVIFNSGLGTYQEWRAERAMQALRRLITTRVAVERDGHVVEVDASRIVPGDMVWLESGNRVPADLRIVSEKGLEVDESLLTGESTGVTKDAGWVATDRVPVSERRNMLFAGAVVLRGRAQGVATGTGSRTEVGRIAEDVMRAVSATPPLMIRMKRLARFIAIAILVGVGVLAVAGVLRGEPVQQMFFFAVALAVAAIPEGLPAALTVALTVATVRMVRRHVIVRRLPAVESLGSCTLVATDKTGTLTQNELTVTRVLLPDGSSAEVKGIGFVPEGEVVPGRDSAQDGNLQDALVRLAKGCVLVNEGSLHKRNGEWVTKGDPTDLALLAFAGKLGIEREAVLDRYPQVNHIPFESERRWSASHHGSGQQEVQVYVKGAPERVLNMCRSGTDHDRLQDQVHGMLQEGLRVIAVATGHAPGVTAEGIPSEPKNLELLGLVGMLDPPRDGVPEAVRAAQEAGIKVVMVTGDHPVTALAIARDLNIADAEDKAVTGEEVEGADDERLKQWVETRPVFARTTPHQKLRLVQAAQARGHFVAVTGDGVNDAPALRAAHIGVSMGKSGTDVAREASDIVLTDDDFPSIVAGVEEGRVSYDNIRKVVYLLVSTGAGALVLILLALGAGLPLPLLPAQLLWLNIVTQGIQHIALAMEPNEGDVMRRPPRPPKQPVFDRWMIERVVVAALTVGIVSYVAYDWMLRQGWEVEQARNAVLLLNVFLQNIHLGNARSEARSAFALSPFRNPFLLMAVVGAQLVHLAATHVPFMQVVLRVEPFTLGTWVALLGVSLSIVVVVEIQKAVHRGLRRRRGDPLPSLRS